MAEIVDDAQMTYLRKAAAKAEEMADILQNMEKTLNCTQAFLHKEGLNEKFMKFMQAQKKASEELKGVPTHE